MPLPPLKINTRIPPRHRALFAKSLEDRSLLAAAVGVFTPEANYHVLEGSPASFYLTLSESVPASVTVAWRTVAGTATENDDYEGKSGTVVFPGGVSQTGVSVATYLDSVMDASETFSLVIESVASSASVSISNSAATVTIDDCQPTGTSGGTGGGTSGGTGGSGTTGGGTGGSGGTGGTTGGGASGGSTGGTGGTTGGGAGGTGEPPVQNGPTITYRVDRLDDAVEGISQGRFKVSRPLESTPPQIVYFRFAPSSLALMNNLAETIPDADYVPSTFPYQIPFASGQWESIIYIGAYADNVEESPESVTLELLTYAAPGAGPVPYLLNANHASATLTIKDAPLVTLGNASMSEGDTGSQNVTIPLSLQFAVAIDITVEVKTTDGTALESDQDYVGGTKTVVIPAGQTQPATPLTFQVKGDDKVEPDEKFTAKILAAGACRIDAANIAEITIQNDDYAPDLNGVPTTPYSWSEGEQITLNIASRDNDTSWTNVSYTITGTPPGSLHIYGNAQGYWLTGRLNFLAFADTPYSMTVVATDASGNSNSKTFTATVSNTGFSELTAVEVHYRDYGFGTSYDTSNHITATTPTLTAWTVSDQNWIRITTATNPADAEDTGLIRPSDFQIEFEPGAFATGTGTSMHRLTGDSGLISLKLDLNLDGAFGPGSTTQSILVSAANFSGALIPHRRIADGPIEPVAFPLRDYERMEVFGTFGFELTGPRTNSITEPNPTYASFAANSSLFRYEMRNEGIFDQVTRSGPGTTFSRKMQGTDASYESATVRFYYDTNDNGSYDSDELKIEKSGIQIREASVITLNVSYSDAILNFDQSYAETAIVLAGYMALQRDTLTDWRSLIDFRIGNVAQFPAGGRDPIINQTDALQFTSTLGTDLIFVKNIALPDGGGNDDGTLGLTQRFQHSSVIEFNRGDASKLGNVIIHEYGHQLGWGDISGPNWGQTYDPNYAENIMFFAWTNARSLSKAQAEHFEQR